MKLLVVNWKLGYSSTSTYSFELCRALKERGHETRLITGGGEFREAFRREAIESYVARFNFFSFRKLIQILTEFNPDLIHAQNLRSLSMAQKFVDRLKKPHVVTIHHVPSGVHERLKHPDLCGIIAVNEAVRESLVNSQRIPKELIRVIRSGVNLKSFIPGEPLSSNGDKLPVVASIGRLDTVKGHQYLIAAARRVLDGGREAMFVVVGDGLQERDLRRQVQKLQLEKHVTFCPPLPNLAEVISDLDIVVVPTLRGGVGSIAIEAMAMAKPVVASAVGELLHLVGDGTTGLLVREGDEKAIAEKILYLLDNPEEARRLGEAARKWVEENCSLALMVDATEAFYQEAMEDSG